MSLGNLILIQRRWSALFILVSFSLMISSAFEIHISSSDPGGTEIFHTSLGERHPWMYELGENNSSNALHFVLVHPKSGVVYLKRKVDCKDLKNNPFLVPIKITSGAKYSPPGRSHSVLLPLFIFVHGENCNHSNNLKHHHAIIHNHRLKDHERKHVHSLHIEFISLKECFQPFQPVLSLADFIPLPLRSCKLGANSLTPNAYLQPQSLNIFFKHSLCMRNKRHHISVLLKLTCPISQLRGQVVHYAFTLRTLSSKHKVSKSKHRIRRRRREVSNSAPIFDPTQYTKHVKEEQEPGLPVITITAEDSDSGDAGKLTYRMDANRNTRSQDMFSINPQTGTIKTVTRLNREQMGSHYFTIYATDNAIPESDRLSATASLTIIVDDINDHSPDFQQVPTEISVDENGGDGMDIFLAKAIDKDEGANKEIRYSILNPEPPNDIFMIDPQNGDISSRRSLDREEVARYKLIIQAVDQGKLSERRTSTMTLTVNVNDENDNRPKFTESEYILNLREDQPVSRTKEILRLKATDKDKGENAEIIYNLGQGQDQFMINRTTGYLYLIHPLDFEDTEGYKLSVRAEDQGIPLRFQSIIVLVNVIDVNDNVPEFLEPSYFKNVDEDIDVGDNVLQVQATDRDSGPNSVLSYSLVKPANAPSLPFTIQADTGWITTTAKLDRESVNKFEFVVVAKDNGAKQLSASVSVTVGIRDVNDNKPVFKESSYTASISEEAKKGDAVIHVVAEDKDEGDNARMSYHIERGNDKQAFQIRMVQGEGVIVVNKKLDARDQNKYVLTVSAMDIDGKKDSVQVIINVLDTNRHAPELQRKDSFAFSVSEDTAVGTSVFEVLALDSDRGENARITYSLTPLSVFSIEPVTGIIRTRQKLDRETVADYMLNVKATDNGKPALSDEAEVLVTVSDVNDNSPEFTEHRYSGRVKENVQVGSKMLNISANDKDKGFNGQVRYTFEGGNDGGGTFNIDNLGWIWLVKQLDRETKSSYDLIAIAKDSDPVAPQSSSVTVHIDVIDVNDNSPVFDSSIFNVMIEENSPIGSTVARITADDPDEGENALVEYSFASGSDSDYFKLSGRLGDPAIITTIKNLDYEQGKQQYKVILTASSDTFISTAQVLINIQDINDNTPVFEDFSIIYNNFVGNFPGAPIGKVPAFDPDVSDRDRLVYKILSGNEAQLLHLNETSGQVTLDPRLNSDVPRYGEFLMSVTDGVTVVSATCQLWVRLVTTELLHHAVTIRLNKMTANAFLSPLLTFFTDSLASILKVEPSNIFVINVEDDTDVNAQILNVSVSIRSDSVLVQGQTRDVFYDPEYIREVIYLHRAELANLSTLEVLPFDDNLCLLEPCTNFDECRSIVQQGIARPFISSNTVLFRPIHPNLIFNCGCPPGFASMNQSKMCDTEIDLCYSHPCHNGGTCLRKENGYTCVCPSEFTGPSCDLNMTSHYDSLTCPAGQCHSQSMCTPSPGGGFVCTGCPSDGYHDHQCRLRSIMFHKGSYATFPSIKARNRLTIQLKFSTQSKDGLLFYNGRFNGEHDFIALEIVDSQVRFSFNLGANETATVTTNVDGGVSTGQWTQVTVEYVSRVATVAVGEDCDSEITIRFGDRLGSHACAVRVELELPEICDNPMKNCNRLLDLTGPLQLGSLPVSFNAEQFNAPDFEGCISDLYLDHSLIDLGSAIASHQTTVGCPPKNSRCHLFPCKKGGKCREGWNTFLCDCPERTGGKDCSQPIELSRQFRGKGYMYYENFAAPVIRYPWLNGIAFRTRRDNGVIMQILLNREKIVVELVKGYLHYIFGDLVIVMDMTRVDDGFWHYFEVRWYKQGTIELFLDYEQHTKKVDSSMSINTRTIQVIYVGAYRDGNKPMSRFFNGCVKDIRVGNGDQTYLVDPRTSNVETGCMGDQVCDPNPCGAGQCVDLWKKHECQCPPGTIGPKCQEICANFDPCKYWAECKTTQDENYRHGYKCECGSRQSGRYCEHLGPKTCPSGWWGKPVCGPCHCDEDRGFQDFCDKDNGSCICKPNHYLSVGSDVCLPCNCYGLGSKSPSCHPVTGQCECYKSVVGRRCDQCENIYAAVSKARSMVVGEDGKEKEIGLVTCLVTYDGCPRNHAEGVWWDEIAFGLEANQECPAGTTGSATRQCAQKYSWLKPDLFQCTSDNFLALEAQLNDTEKGLISPFIADYTVGILKNITYTTTPIYGGDIMMTYRFTKVLLEYEISHSGLEMISQQYRDFVQKLLVALSNVTNNSYSDYWLRVNEEFDGAGNELISLLEKFVDKVVRELPQAKSGTFEAVSSDVVLGTDWVDTLNYSGVTIPKYNNNVRKGDADEEGTVRLPSSLFSSSSSSSSGVSDSTTTPSLDQSRAYVGYMFVRDLAQHMTMDTDSTIRRTDRPMTVNGPILGLTILHQNKVLVNLKEPISLKFRLRFPNNRTNMYCARWVPSPTNIKAGQWTTRGCKTKETSCQVSAGSDRCEEYFVTCECTHLSSFAVIIDVADGTTLLPPLIDMEVMTYVLTVISLLLLLVSFFALFTFKRLQCNWNSIHINLIFTVFIIQLAFLIGINRPTTELFCRLVAIALHFFYMAAFVWLFVEVLHMYRLLTEKQTINYGSMKFYYLLGYVLPGIVVGLAVGLYTEAYGNASFCWLLTSENFIWSFAGPVAVTVVLIMIAFFYAAKASYTKKSPLHDINAVRMGLLIALILLLLLSATWVIGLLSVNYVGQALHYIHSVLMFADGLFIFLVYIALNKKVRWCIKRFYYRLQGKKVEFDEQNAASRNPVQSRSALAYRHDSSTNGSGVRISNVGISTTSTVSRSSKGTSLAKSGDILHSTSSSTSGGVTNLNTSYGFESPFKDKIKEEAGEDHKGGHDSDSDSDASMDRHSLELASSHSSDDDDDFDLGQGWENHLPQSKAVELAREQIEKMRKEKKSERISNNNEEITTDSQGIEEIPENPSRSPPHFPMPSNPPDVTLTSMQRPPVLRPVVPPIRSDSLHVSPKPKQKPLVSHTPNTVQVFTHNGSVSTDSESDETTV